MKKIVFGLALIVAGVITACGGQNSCKGKSVEEFDSFIGIKYGTGELEIEKVLGSFTGGEYTSDSSAFIYYFNRIDRVPISIYVNAKSGKVETIFMEVLSYADNFNDDLDKAKDEFKMTDCDTYYFGMKEDEVKKAMGEPAYEETLEDGVKSISYDSDSYKYSVNFKFYPEQENMCSSIMVNWFY